MTALISLKTLLNKKYGKYLLSLLKINEKTENAVIFEIQSLELR